MTYYSELKRCSLRRKNQVQEIRQDIVMIIKLAQTKTYLAGKKGCDKNFSFKEELNVMAQGCVLLLLILSNPINKTVRSQVKTSKEVSLHTAFSNLSKGCCENKKITLVLKSHLQEEKSYQGTDFMTLERLEGIKRKHLVLLPRFYVFESLAHTYSSISFLLHVERT